MTIRLDENLRRLRLQAGLTQSALAEQLGVSDRAVSRWETGSSAPDISLLPGLAMLLETSVDALLGVDPERMAADLDRAYRTCTELLGRGDAPSAVAMLREVSAVYPNQPELMVYLARALLALKTEEGAREALALCRRADGRPMRLSATFGCKQVMALALNRLGQKEVAAKLVGDEMPAIWVCRELMLPRVAPDDQVRAMHQHNLLLFAWQLAKALTALAMPGDEIILLEKAARILEEITGGSGGLCAEQLCRVQCRLALAHARREQFAEAAHSIRQAIDAADAFSARDGRKPAPWLSELPWDPPAQEEVRRLLDMIRTTLTDPVMAGCEDLPALMAALDRLA